VLKDFTDAGVEALLWRSIGNDDQDAAVTNEYVQAMWKRHPKRIIQAWGALEPAKGEVAIAQAKKAVRELA